MAKKFCTTGTCIPEKNYMVDLSNSRLSINISNQDNTLRSIEPDNMVRQPCFIFWKKNCENKIIWF